MSDTEFNSSLPNDALTDKPQQDIPDRSSQIKIDGTDEPIYVTLMQIDETIINYVIKVIKPSVNDNDRMVPVPVIIDSPERWKAIRKDASKRDEKNDKIQTPLIVFTRSNVSRNSQMTNPNNKYLYLTYQTPWNSRNAYDKFSVLNGIRPSSKLQQVIVPDYVDITYDILLWTEYQEQMNHLIEIFNVENEEWWGLRNQFKFRVKIENYKSENELPTDENRVIRTSFSMNVPAYLIPEKMVKNFNLISTNLKAYTAKKVVSFLNESLINSPDVVGYYNKVKANPSN